MKNNSEGFQTDKKKKRQQTGLGRLPDKFQDELPKINYDRKTKRQKYKDERNERQ